MDWDNQNPVAAVAPQLALGGAIVRPPCCFFQLRRGPDRGPRLTLSQSIIDVNTLDMELTWEMHLESSSTSLILFLSCHWSCRKCKPTSGGLSMPAICPFAAVDALLSHSVADPPLSPSSVAVGLRIVFFLLFFLRVSVRVWLLGSCAGGGAFHFCRTLERRGPSWPAQGASSSFF